jgi:hypothetical protein
MITNKKVDLVDRAVTVKKNIIKIYIFYFI